MLTVKHPETSVANTTKCLLLVNGSNATRPRGHREHSKTPSASLSVVITVSGGRKLQLSGSGCWIADRGCGRGMYSAVAEAIATTSRLRRRCNYSAVAEAISHGIRIA